MVLRGGAIVVVLLVVAARAVVHEADEKTFADFVGEKSEKAAIVKFYAPWCGHCQELKPVFEKVSDRPDSGDVAFVAVDAEKHAALGDKYHVEAYPTVLFFPKGSDKPHVSEYQDGAVEDALARFVEERKAADASGKARLDDGTRKPTEEDGLDAAFLHDDDDAMLAEGLGFLEEDEASGVVVDPAEGADKASGEDGTHKEL